MAKKRKTMVTRLSSQLAVLNRQIEVKENTRTVSNLTVPHNNLIVLALNPFQVSGQGAGDPAQQNEGNRVGDSITVKSLLIRAFFETTLGRAKVYFRFMLVRMSKGDTLDRTTFFKNSSNNKMIDLVNNERFTIIANRMFNVSASNNTAAGVLGTGIPSVATPAGIGTKTISMRVPGKRFGRNGVIQYENQNVSQVKFYDYRLVVVCYDWYGTPQDLNNVGLVNECFTKLYFQDA